MHLSRTQIFVLIAAGLWFGAFFWIVRDSFVDDAYIGFSCLRNFLEGRGLFLNSQEQVECVTNIGWLFFLLPLASITSPTFAAKFAGFLLIITGLFLLWLSICRATDEENYKIMPTAVVICSLSSFEFLYYSFAGMETSLCFTLIAAIIYFNQRKSLIISAFLAALAFSVRPETILIFPLFLLISSMKRLVDFKSAVKAISLLTALLLFQQLLRFWYFDALVPNTFIAKPGNISAFFRGLASLLTGFGQQTNVYFIFAGLPSIGLVLAGFSSLWRNNRQRDAALCLSIAFTGYFFSIYARQDWTGNARYFAPYLPFCYWLLFEGINRISSLFKFSLQTTRRFLLAAVAIVTMLSASETVFLLRPETGKMYPHFIANSLPLVKPAEWIVANTPANSIIATRRIGCLAYYGQRRIFDYKYGLPHRQIALLIRQNGEPFNNPKDPKLAESWQKISPDYIIEDSSSIYAFGYRRHKGALNIHGIDYRPIKEFPINDDTAWMLCQKIGQ